MRYDSRTITTTSTTSATSLLPAIHPAINLLPATSTPAGAASAACLRYLSLSRSRPLFTRGILVLVLFPGALEGISGVLGRKGGSSLPVLARPRNLSPCSSFGFLAEHTQTDGSRAFLPMLLHYYQLLFEFSLDFLCCKGGGQFLIELVPLHLTNLPALFSPIHSAVRAVICGINN
jgi:hypothetical protein